MKNSILVLSVLASSFAGSAFADPGDTRYLFKASALFPVQIEKVDPRDPANTIITKLALGTKELVNLALARPIGQAIDSKAEILIVNVNASDPNQTSLQVYRPDLSGQTGGILYPICNISPGSSASVKLTENGHTSKDKGTGLGPGKIVATTAGTPALRALNSLQSTEICAASNGSWTENSSNIPTFSAAATGIIGDIKGKMTDKNNVTSDLDGLIIKGMYTSSGKPIEPFPNGYIEP